jgi:hypothetical protein
VKKPWPSAQNEAKNLNIFNACTRVHAVARARSAMREPHFVSPHPGYRMGRQPRTDDGRLRNRHSGRAFIKPKVLGDSRGFLLELFQE